MADATDSVADKIAYFQDVTGMKDLELAKQILEAHGWDLDAAVNAMVMDPNSHAIDHASSRGIASVTHLHEATAATAPESSGRSSHYGASTPPYNGDAGVLPFERDSGVGRNPQPSMLIWKLVTLPFSIIRGSYNIVYGAVGLGMWLAGGVISYSLDALGRSEGRIAEGQASLLPLPVGAVEAEAFLRNFERQYGVLHPSFQTTTIVDALRRATAEFKLLFVYLHSPEHANTPPFCETTLCSEAVVQFVNENFVSWGADVRSNEGFQMSNSLRASTFPFCAIVMASSNQRIVLLQQMEGFKSASELLAILQRVLEEQGLVLVAARADQEERTLNRRLREEQDAAYRAALQADQEREQRRQEEAERAARAAAEAERRRREEDEVATAAAKAATEREAALEQRRQEKAMLLGPEPEKGPDVTHVVLRFPNGERKERRFHRSNTVQSVYDYVDSLGNFDAVKYSLVSNFPRTVYDQGKLGLSLKDAGLHPHASLFVQAEES